MSLLPYRSFFDDAIRDMQHQMTPSYWGRPNDSLAFATTSCDIVNNENKFGIEMDVSHFRPEELKVHVNGHLLTIEGHHQLRDRDSFMERSFTRKWTLPEDVDLSAIHSTINRDGHLFIDAPKSGSPAQRSIPIEHKHL